MIPTAPQLSDSNQPDAIRANFRKLNEWMKEIERSGVGWSEVKNKPTTFTPATHAHAASDVTSGTFDPARIPAVEATVTVGAGAPGAGASGDLYIDSSNNRFYWHDGDDWKYVTAVVAP